MLVRDLRKISKKVSDMAVGLRELQHLGIVRLSPGSSMIKATLALIKIVGDELSEKGTYNILLDSLNPLPDAALAYKMAIGLSK